MGRETSPYSRLLKQSASIVLASFRPSTYHGGCASGLHSLRPCWTACLSSLREDIYSRGLVRSTFRFGRRWSCERIVGPGVFGIAATEFFSDLEIGGPPETRKILRDLDGLAGR